MLQQPASVVWAIIIPGGINPIHVRSKQLLTSSPGKQNFARPPILSCSASASNWVFFHSMSVYVWQCPLPVLFSRFNASDSFCRFIYDAMSSLFINRSPRNPQKWIHLVLATTPASLLTRIHLNLTVLWPGEIVSLVTFPHIFRPSRDFSLEVIIQNSWNARACVRCLI